MHPLPHHYRVGAFTAPHDPVLSIDSPGVPPLHTTTPPEFDGPDGQWSPETLLVASVLDCFALTFRGIARASRLDWTSLTCRATGTLERVDHVMQFTGFTIDAQVEIPDAAHADLARHVAEKADRTCLIANSLKGAIRLHVDVHVSAPELLNAALQTA